MWEKVENILKREWGVRYNGHDYGCEILNGKSSIYMLEGNTKKEIFLSKN